ncbi:unnamed protein product [marine sediment metagenome]|uniref:Uncharacterized protein n=1 Tax=marine sediment metagenome TaxID=412755 RepID=X1LNW6_9ZZZZ
MTSQMLNPAQNDKRKRIMQYFLDTPYYLVKGDVAELDHTEAQVRWMLVKANYAVSDELLDILGVRAVAAHDEVVPAAVDVALFDVGDDLV